MIPQEFLDFAAIFLLLQHCKSSFSFFFWLLFTT